MTRVVISQPMYFPWVGFIAQMALADVLIWLDDVQFSKGSFTNRIQVKMSTGRSWMSVPLVNKGSGLLIQDLTTTDITTPNRHKDLLSNALGNKTHGPEMLRTFAAAWMQGEPLVDSIINSAEMLADAINLPKRQTFRSSQLNVEGSGSDRVLALVKAVGGDTYITGHGAYKYLDHIVFDAAGVEVRYMDYQPKPWPQDHGEFTPYVTALDLVAQVSARERYGHLAPQTLAWQTFLERN